MRYALYFGYDGEADNQLKAESDDLSEITGEFFKLAEQAFDEQYDRVYVWDNDKDGIYIGVLNHEKIH